MSDAENNVKMANGTGDSLVGCEGIVSSCVMRG